MQKNISGKHVLITGGSRGIGLAIGRRLAAAGLRLSLVGRDENLLRQAAASLQIGERVTTIVADLRQPAKSVPELMAKTTTKFGAVDILINNAGVYTMGPSESAELADWDAMLDVNLRAAMHCAQGVLPAMLRAGSGAIVNIGSIAGRVGFAQSAAYCASKFGLRGFSEALFEEVRERGILVSWISPGMTQTSMTAGMAGADSNKMLAADDIAAAIYWVLTQSENVAPVCLDLWPQRNVFG